MKTVVQRVRAATLSVDGKEISRIGQGLVVYLGIKKGDGEHLPAVLAKKLVNLRVFSDENGKMNLSVSDVGGEILLVSQFTLLADTSHGNRPSFFEAEVPEKADTLYQKTAAEIEALGVVVKRGVFGADMQILQQNDGPVTIELEF